MGFLQVKNRSGFGKGLKTQCHQGFPPNPHGPRAVVRARFAALHHDARFERFGAGGVASQSCRKPVMESAY